MYRKIENLEKKTAQLQTELDALKEVLLSHFGVDIDEENKEQDQ